MSKELVIKDWNIESVRGYKPITTCYTDFSIADNFGEKAIKDTYKMAIDNWKNDIKYLTEIAMALNWKSWEHADGNKEYCSLYNDLFYEVQEMVLGDNSNYSKEDIAYYLKTTD